MAARLRPPHLLPGQDAGREGSLLFESPLESWHQAVESGRGRLVSVEKLAALALSLAVMFAQIGFGVGTASAAATFVVNSTADRVDISPGNGSCDTGNLVNGSPECTLRAAVQEANALAGTDTINVPSGTYTLTIAGTNENAAATGDLDLTDGVTIVGAGAGSTIIDGNGADRIFETVGTLTASISDLTITNGTAYVNASAVYLGANTTTTLDSVVVGNSQHAPAVRNDGTLNLNDSRVTGNTSDLNGAGLFASGPATVTNTLIDNNSTSVNGGGIYAGGAGGGLNLTNVTLSGNSASVGGGIYNEISTSLVNVTITNNSATQSGGLQAASGQTSVLNTIIAGNIGGNPDANGNVNSQGYNIIETVGGSTGWIGSDRTGVDPQLQALADNGGPTPTHALIAGSEAIDNGTASGAPATDQRGVTRDASPDIGAYEFAVANSAPTADAGGPYTITEGGGLTPDGSGSSDPDTDPLTYSWDLDNDLAYGDATGVSPTVSWGSLQTFGITGVGVYTIGLQVDDGNGHTDTDTASLTVDPTSITVVVNSTGDGSDASPGDGVCDTGGTNSEGADECTLRAAIEEANATATVDTIEFSLPVTVFATQVAQTPRALTSARCGQQSRKPMPQRRSTRSSSAYR